MDFIGDLAPSRESNKIYGAAYTYCKDFASSAKEAYYYLLPFGSPRQFSGTLLLILQEGRLVSILVGNKIWV